MEYKVISLEGEISEEGKFEGWLTKYGEEDLVNDIVEKGAFNKSLSKKKVYPLLWNHTPHEPIGVSRLEDREEGVKVYGELELNVQRAKEIYSLIKKGVVNGISYGYIPRKVSYSGDKRILKEIDIFEVSLTVFPAHPSALITEVKHVLPYQDLPLADADTPWDAGEARKRIAKWASSDGSGDKDKIDWEKYSKAFLYVIKGQEENITGYKFPIADVFDGRLKAVPRAIFNAVVRLSVAKIPEEDKEGIRKILAKYYEKMGRVPPWEEDDGEEKSYLFIYYLEDIIRNPLCLADVDRGLLLKAKECIDIVLNSKPSSDLENLLNTLKIIYSEVKI